MSKRLHSEEHIFAYLDDIYILAKPTRVRELYDMLAALLKDHANISINEGKTRVWNRGGICPEHVADLGENVWSPEGVVILGTPLGQIDFVQQHAQKRIEEERKLWNMLTYIPDLQCAWQVLLQSASPRCDHLLRILQPTDVRRYACAHDREM